MTLITNWHRNAKQDPAGWKPDYDTDNVAIYLNPTTHDLICSNKTASSHEVTYRLDLPAGDWIWHGYLWAAKGTTMPDIGWLLVGPDSGSWSTWGMYKDPNMYMLWVNVAFTVPASYTGKTKLNLEVPAGNGNGIHLRSQVVATKQDWAAIQRLGLPDDYFDGDTMPLANGGGGGCNTHPRPVHAARPQYWGLAA